MRSILKLTTKQIHREGMLQARFCDWNVRNITKIYIDSLTESNFHTFRKKVVKLYNKEFKAKLKLNG